MKIKKYNPGNTKSPNMHKNISFLTYEKHRQLQNLKL